LRCELILLHSHWVLVVIDVFTRRIIGFGIERASIDGIAACRVHRAIAGLTPAQFAGALSPARAALDHYGWQQHCRGLFELPIAA
jgi:transposase InsO family protein